MDKNSIIIKQHGRERIKVSHPSKKKTGMKPCLHSKNGWVKTTTSSCFNNLTSTYFKQLYVKMTMMVQVNLTEVVKIIGLKLHAILTTSVIKLTEVVALKHHGHFHLSMVEICAYYKQLLLVVFNHPFSYFDLHGGGRC